jgi:hypothetical protein
MGQQTEQVLALSSQRGVNVQQVVVVVFSPCATARAVNKDKRKMMRIFFLTERRVTTQFLFFSSDGP